MEATLGYWDIRGLAHAIRLLLEYTRTPYEEKRYVVGKEGAASAVIYSNPKMMTCGDIILPYLIDGERKITQSNAILRYIACKHKMCGETEEEMNRLDMLESQFMDFRIGLGKLCYSPDFEKLKPEYLELLPGKLKQYSQFLGDRKWFAGNKLSYVDFIAYDTLDIHQMLEPKCLDQFPNLKEFLRRFEALEKIAAYMKSSRCIKTPIFSSCAMWGNKKSRGDHKPHRDNNCRHRVNERP